MDPYVQHQPASIKMLKQMKRTSRADENSTELPPIIKHSSSNVGRQNQRAYKPLIPPKAQKNTSTVLRDNSNIIDDSEPAKNKRDKPADNYIEKNLERLKKLQEKKAQEAEMIENERKKAQEEREKLRKIVFKRAEEHRRKKEQRLKEEEEHNKLEEERKKLEEEQEKLNPKPSKKKNLPKNNPEQTANPDEDLQEADIVEDEEKKEENAKIKKYFKNRYISFLKTLKEDNIKKKEEEEKAKQKEERIKAKMLQKFGIDNVQSRFRSEPPNPASNEEEKQSRGKPRSENRLMTKLTQAREVDSQINEEKKKVNKEVNERIRK